MGVREVAQSVVEALNKEKGAYYDKVEFALMIGFFEGVAKGNITVGQNWLIPSLRGKASCPHDLSESLLAALREAASMGIFAEGQNLGLGVANMRKSP